MAGKMLAKYGPPWKWRKAAALSRKLFGLVDEATDALRGWHKASKELDEARTGLRKATEAASCSANSFTAETPVLLADGTERPIEQVKVGDQVQATDPQTGETGARPVTQLIRHTGPHTMVDLTLADGSVLHTTDHHPLWDATTNRFAHAIDLHPGEQLQRADGTLLTLAAVVIRQQNLTAYNLTIAGIHTYYAGTTPLLVHNSCSNPSHLMGAEPHAREGVSLEGPGRATPDERQLVNEAGDANGCHSCGSASSGRKSGNWTVDHQPPSGLVRSGTPQTGWPQCASCSNQQGGFVRGMLYDESEF